MTMQGSLSTTLIPTQTVSSTGVGGYWQDGQWIPYWPWYTPPAVNYYHVVEPPRECSGDVHVFPCPHCEKCKCGAATITRPKATR